MNKQEFLQLLEDKTDESAKKFATVMTEYTENCELKHVKDAVIALDVLKSTMEFMRSYNDQNNKVIWKEPFTLEDAITAIESSIVDCFIETLEDS